MADVTCVRCGETKPGLAFAPFNNELGKRLHAEVCQDCWAVWLQRQTALINHYGLNLRDPEVPHGHIAIPSGALAALQSIDAALGAVT